MTQISIINLPPVVAQLFNGQTAVDLDLPIEFSIRLTKSVEQLSILNKISTEGALGFSVPFTPTNDRLFTEYMTPLTLGTPTLFYNVRVIVNSVALQFARLYVRGKSESSREWELELVRDPNHWVELASQVFTNDLPFGIFQMTKDNIVASWANNEYIGDPTDLDTGSPVYWPLVDYGGWCDLTDPPQQAPNNRVKSVAVEDFRPWLSFRYILQAGFCAFGWSIQSVLFESPAFRKIWMYSLRQDYYIASDDQLGGRVSGGIYNNQTFDTGDKMLLDEVTVLSDYSVIDNSTFPIKRFAGIKNFPNVSLKYRFRFNGRFFNNRPTVFTLFFGVFEVVDTGGGQLSFSGEMISTETLNVDFAPGETKDVIFDQVVTFKPGQRGAIHSPVLPTTIPGMRILGGLKFSVTPANESYMTDDIIDVQKSVSDEVSILDWTKALVNICQGRIETDFDTRTVTIHPNKTSDFWGDTIPGFILRENPVVDLNELIVPDSIKLKPFRNDLKRFTRFEFKDTTDAGIRALNLLDPAHSRKLLNNLDLPNQIERVQNPLIEPTIEGPADKIGSGAGSGAPLPNLPRLWDNTSGNRSFTLGVRMLYAYGPVQQINPSPITTVDTFANFFFNNPPNPANTGLTNLFGYATQSPSWAMTTVIGTLDNLVDPVDIVFGIKSRDLFTTFYLGYTQDNRSGQIADVLLRMNIAQYGSYDFRKLFRFNIRGLPIIAPMTEIRDFSSAEYLPTPTKFFIEPAALECCDLPCGCQFIQCDYYQDFGVYMRQSTIDDYRITSFVVDGIELLTAPVTFGTIKYVDIAEKPFITNLVDALNSIGAPYFSFNYSNRLHPSKGLRFFTIKHPVCTQFEIVISEFDEPIYRYSNTEQQQKYFQPGWDDMGYAPLFLSAPDNCITTTEY